VVWVALAAFGLGVVAGMAVCAMCSASAAADACARCMARGRTRTMPDKMSDEDGDALGRIGSVL